MRHALIVLAVFCWFARPASGQPAPIDDPLLERLAGTWVLRGTIAGQETTHDVVAEWILGHQYLRIHELSREKDAKGQAQYEAVVHIGWDAAAAEYQCLWLDSTGGGGLSAQAIAHGKRSGDAIPFLFREPDGSISFNNTFSYDKGSDSWTWHLDNMRDGKPVPFGRVRLTRPQLGAGAANPVPPQDPPSTDDSKKLQQTLERVRDVGIALFAWLTEEVGDDPNLESGRSIAADEGATIDWSRCPDIAYSDLVKLLVPSYLREVPALDGWGNPLQFCLNRPNLLKPSYVVGVRSSGRDGRFEAAPFRRTLFDPTDFDHDVVWLDGYFVARPHEAAP